MTPLRDLSGPIEGVRNQLFGTGEPAVLRGLVAGWTAVREARNSPQALVRYLGKFDNGTPVDALLTPPEVHGRIFYNDTLSGFNFIRNRLSLSAIAEQVLRYAKFPTAPSVAAQSAPIHGCLPGFDTDNSLSVLPQRVAPRIWLGNRITTPTHVDEWNNVACVVAGRRRFTLFPPDQVSNLYIGPLDFAPTGAAMSLVSLHDPDLVRYPKFREALAAAQVAELGPGDAIFIPALWWHHVESLEPFNVLVNYWWHDTAGEGVEADSAFDALLHGILSIRNLPPATRRAWAALFEHYLFAPTGDAIDHVPAERHGVLGDLTFEQRSRLRVHLAKKLGRNP